MDIDVEYDVEYLPDKDGVHQAKATITKAEPKCETCRHNDEEWYSTACDSCCGSNSHYEPSGDLISRAEAIEVGNKIVEELTSSSIVWNDLKDWAKELFNALPSADRPKGEDWDKYSEKLWKSAYERGKAETLIQSEPMPFGMLKAKAKKKADADRPQVNSAEWVAEKEREFEELHRPPGKWIKNDVIGWKCSRCGIITNLVSNYCPHCGAKMKGEQDGDL